MSGRKQFDPELFAENDMRARAAVLGYLHSEGIHAIENPDLYGPDLIIYSGYRPISYSEVEIKRVWRQEDGTFPWPTIQLPERKAKFLRKRLPVEFWILNSTCTYAVVIPETELSSSILKEVPNSQVAEGERFFQIPIENCIIKSLA